MSWPKEDCPDCGVEIFRCQCVTAKKFFEQAKEINKLGLNVVVKAGEVRVEWGF